MPESRLPETLQPIAELIGGKSAMDLARHWGGRRLYVPPVIPDASHPIAAELGLDVTVALAYRSGPDTHVRVGNQR